MVGFVKHEWLVKDFKKKFPDHFERRKLWTQNDTWKHQQQQQQGRVFGPKKSKNEENMMINIDTPHTVFGHLMMMMTENADSIFNR